MTILILEEITSGGATPIIELTGGDKVIGRDPTVDIVLPTAGVSRVHGGFQEVNGRWLYRDLRSTNGSWLNGVRLTPELWQVIRDSDLMQIGDAVIRLRLVDGPQLSNDTASAALLIVQEGGNVDVVQLSEDENSQVLQVVPGRISLLDDLSKPGPTVSFLNQSMVISDPSGHLGRIDSALNDQATFVLHDRDGLIIGNAQLLLDCFPPIEGEFASQQVLQVEDISSHGENGSYAPVNEGLHALHNEADVGQEKPQFSHSLGEEEDPSRFSRLSKVERGRSSPMNYDAEPIGPETRAIDTAELRAQFSRMERRPIVESRRDSAGSLGEFVRNNPIVVIVTMAFFMCLGVILALFASKYVGK